MAEAPPRRSPGGRLQVSEQRKNTAMHIAISKSAGWALAIAGLVLLASAGTLDRLLALVPVSLVPVSLVLGYALVRLSEDRNKLTSPMKKR
jgi:hypothetical protein